ncbi:hypothetical protein QH639_20070 [Lysinibacillus sp. 1 U-2021]|uniref:hypothetical protein n=1 Tax=Lysinibacillus sp. 1 U-2021 TaxID=3039426 RepID=UPI00248152D6|nr:hypothetical protein [Lysinibacillus sp. 1 U-2021]WGT38096.1 hypothetical protein QH639_20070 [Lysinibacillus sp. 1 U-2021]
MSFLLVYLGMIGILVGVILLVIGLIKKKKLKGGLVLGISIAAFVIGFIMVPVNKTESADETKDIVKNETVTKPKEETSNTENTQKDEKVVTSVTNKIETKSNNSTTMSEGERNAEQYPAKAGSMLYDKTESKFKGMEYYFKGEVVGVKSLEGLFGNMEDTLLIKNDQGYVLPVFPPYEIDVNIGDTVEASGPLSGDGYAASDLGVSNVVGMTGAMNATQVSVNGQIQ